MEATNKDMPTGEYIYRTLIACKGMAQPLDQTSFQLKFLFPHIRTTEFDRKFCDQSSRSRHTSPLEADHSQVRRQASGGCGGAATENSAGIAKCDSEALMGIGSQFQDQHEVPGDFVI
jgi:hypothetical protein